MNSHINAQVITFPGDSTAQDKISHWEKLESILANGFTLEDEDRKKRRLKVRDKLYNREPKLPGENTIGYLDRLETIAIERDQELGIKIEDSVRLTCILFGLPSAKLMKDDIIPNLDYWHHRSSVHVDFICIGFNNNKKFSHKGFNEILDSFEKRISWKYSGETDLLIINSYFDTATRRARLDFGNVVVINLENVIKETAIKSVPAFFEEIIAYAAQCDGVDPAWGFSDAMAVGSVKSIFIELILKFLPEAVRNEFGRLKHFAVHDITNRRQR